MAVVDSARATLLGIPEGEISRRDTDSDIEVARAEVAWRCETFLELSGRRDRALAREGTPRDEAWSAFIEPLAQRSVRVTILDRFVIKNAVQRLRNGSAGTRPMIAPGWLLQKIDALPSAGITVEIFSGDDVARVNRQDVPWELDDAREALLHVWGGTPGAGAIERVDLYVASWDASPTLRQRSHDRHLRFDLGCGLEIPAGLDRFDHERLKSDVSIFYGWLPEPLMKLRLAENTVKRERPQRKLTID